MKNLYRRYRPLKLADIVGQDQVIKPLTNSLAANKIAHAYLFVGPRGCGKTSVARILAHEVNGFPYELEDDYVDIIEIDGASNRGIDNIRELREKVAIAPTLGKYKIYIIDEVHMLTKEAFNALLKTLEEPPEHVIFIMATTDAYKVPVTITSRAQTFTFKLAGTDTMVKHLRSICDKEGIKITDDALQIVAKKGGGSFRDSLSLLDQISTLSTEEITKDIVISAMGLPEDEKICELLDSCISGDITKITTLLKELLNSGIKSETLAEEMILTIIENPKPELIPLLSKLPEVKDPFAEAKLIVALFSTSFSDGRPHASSFSQHFTQSSPRSQVTRLGRGNVSENDSGSAGILSEKEAPTKAPNNFTSTTHTSTPTPTSIPTAPTSTSTPTNFTWETFLETVRGMNDAVYSQVSKAEYGVVGNVLNIYPDKKIAKTILSRDNNKRILVEAAGGLKVEIHDVGTNPNNKKDALVSKISDIMGGEVISDGGGNPF